jgi:hypothetical protein
MFSFLRCSAILVLALTALAPLTNAQTITGSISGNVTDSTGGMIPGATVTLTSEKTGQARGSATDSEGRFSFAALQPGAYALKVERQGFQTLEQRGIILSANENLALGDLKLQPGQVSETVSVVSEGAVIERESSDLTARLTADQINLIATKGRDVTSLLRLLPGTSNNDDIEGAGDGFGTDLPLRPARSIDCSHDRWPLCRRAERFKQAQFYDQPGRSCRGESAAQQLRRRVRQQRRRDHQHRFERRR